MKKIIALFAAAALLLLAGCGSGETDYSEIDYSKCLEVLEYSDLSAVKPDDTVTDEEFEQGLKKFLTARGESELSDAFVQSLSDWNCASAAEFEVAYRQYLQATKSAYYENQYRAALWAQVLESAVYTQLGEDYADYFVQNALSECQATATAQGQSLEEFAVAQGYENSEALLSAVSLSADAQARTTMAMYYLAGLEGLEYSEDEYYDACKDYAEYLGYESTADLVNDLGVDELEKTVGDSLIYSLVLDFVEQNAGA